MKWIWYVQVEDNIVEWHCFQISKFTVNKTADMILCSGILTNDEDTVD